MWLRGFPTGVRVGQRQEQKSKRAMDWGSPGWAGSRWRAAHRAGRAVSTQGALIADAGAIGMADFGKSSSIQRSKGCCGAVFLSRYHADAGTGVRKCRLAIKSTAQMPAIRLGDEETQS